MIAKTSIFSSYPASIASNDDFYRLSSGLVVIETTNNIFNTSLYAAFKPESLFVGMRTVIANRMAADGPSWVKFFSQFNSGTCNNQYMVVNYNKFTPNSPLPNGMRILSV
jgi:hypothetical protein